MATEGSARFLAEHNIPHTFVYKLNEGRPDIADKIKNNEIQLIINTPLGKDAETDDSYIRMMAIQHQVAYMTTIAAAKATVAGIEAAQKNSIQPKSLQEYQSMD